MGEVLFIALSARFTIGYKRDESFIMSNVDFGLEIGYKLTMNYEIKDVV